MPAPAGTPGAPSRHQLALKGRRVLDVQGVVSVHSFEEALMVLETQEGTLVVKGEQMHVLALDVEHGTLTVEGLVNSLEYGAQAPGRRARSWLRRLIR
ncbi:MAG TPA: YabP/YqfC family sporulation protein [Limnochordales bacterium]